MEKRKNPASAPLSKSTDLPVDYVRMVSDVLENTFEEGLKALTALRKAEARIEVSGRIYADEVVLAITIAHEGQLAATTVHASADFDPKASSPTVQDLLGACVDAAGGLISTLLDPKNTKRLEQLADESLSALEDIPWDWTQVEVERFRVYLKVDKANPKLEQEADDWLEKNDPEHRERLEREEEEVKKLFVTGPSDKKPGGSSGSSGMTH
jgi:hypothetical protein